MKGAAVRSVGKAAGQRVTGQQPGRAGALVAAMVVGVATAVLTYRLLRG